MANVIYEGFFLLYDWTEQLCEENILSPEKFEVALSKPIEKLHVTTAFRPKEPKFNLYGSYARVDFIGYALSEDNEAYAVDVYGIPEYDDLDEELDDLIDDLMSKNPHVTISVSENGKPKDSVNLSYTLFNAPLTIHAMAAFGAFLDDGRYVFNSKEVIK